jgi:4-amino-4-deoxy-L-arabinose transferase-like glycosyltransferase
VAQQPSVAAKTPTGPGWPALLLVGYLLQVAWRLYLSWPITGPVAHADEDGYMLGARVLAGGAGATLPTWSIMRPIGYPLVLTPAYLLAEDPARVYLIIHVINALLMAATFPLIYLLARRLFGLDKIWAAGLAFVLATLPSMVFFSEFALTDALLPALVMALLLLVYGMLAGVGRRVWWCAIAAGAVAAYAANTHVRGQVMLVVVTVAVVLSAWRRWLPWRAAAAYAASAVVVFGAGWLANKWLEDRLFTTHAYSANGRVFGRLTSIKGIGRTACDGAGQIWHLCTSTYGLAALGLAAAVWALYRREWSRPTRVVLGSALAITIGIALATAAGTPNEGRVNNHVYGRYVAMFAAFWALVGIVALLRAGWRRSAWLVAGGSAIVLLSLGAVLAYAGRRLAHESYVNFDAPELSFLSGDWGSLHIYQMTGYAIGFMVIFAATLAARAPRWLAMLTLTATMVLNLVAMVFITDHISRTWANEQYNTTLPQLVRDAGVRPGDSVAEANTVGWWINLRHQREVYWAALPRFDPTGAPPDGVMFVVAPIGQSTDWDGTRYGYTLVLRYHEAYGNWAVWRHN